MGRLDDPTLKVDRPRPEFRQANPAVFGRTGDDRDTLSRLSVIEQRATGLKDRFRAHFDKHEVAWVLNETLRLLAKRSYPTLDHPKPRNAPDENFGELMMGQARRNVHARALRRLSTINSVKTKLQNAVVRNAPRQALAQRQPSNDRQIKRKLKQSGP